MSLFRERTVFILLTWIRLSHTKNMPRIAALRVANSHHPILQFPETDNPNFFVIFSSVLKCQAKVKGFLAKCLKAEMFS